MFFKRYISEGLAHYSYLIADQGQAVVIDPRRDIDVYLDDAASAGCQITCVLETHRNEDYLVGSCEIEAAAGAEVFHADSQWAYQYGSPAGDGQEFHVGRLKILAMHTPGHTPGSMSYVLNDPDGNPWMVFSGDVLFSGDAGRVDLLGEDRMREMAAFLYESIFKKLLPLGDGVILCPAHGAGSVCGSAIAERSWSTLGLERQLNPKLQVGSQQEFIDKHATVLNRPPYFRKMEVLNLEGPPLLYRLPKLKPLRKDAFSALTADSQIVDTREPADFAAAHVPGSLAIGVDKLAALAGWFLNFDDPTLFVSDPNTAAEIAAAMIRIGFDQLSGYLGDGILGWTLAGKPITSIKTYTAEEFCSLLEKDDDVFPVDVRGDKEINGEALRHGVHIPLFTLLDQMEKIPRDRIVAPVCPRGNRSMLAASLLKRAGWKDLAVPLGGLGALGAIDCSFEL